MGARLRKTLAAFLLLLAACGDGTLVVFVNSGVIVGRPRCTNAGGEFDLRDEGGGLVLVVIVDGTDVVVAGRVGGCSDLFTGARTSVEGRRSGGRIVASSVTVD